MSCATLFERKMHIVFFTPRRPANGSDTKKFSRVLKLRLDFDRWTATTEWEVRLDQFYYSECCSSVARIPHSENFLVLFGNPNQKKQQPTGMEPVSLRGFPFLIISPKGQVLSTYTYWSSCLRAIFRAVPLRLNSIADEVEAGFTTLHTDGKQSLSV